MGLFDSFLSLSASTPGPASDFWYEPVGGTTAASGQRVDADTARKVSAWYRGRDLLATSLAMLPLYTLERLPNGDGANPARFNPLFDVLHDAPNTWQDSFGWRRQLMYHLIDHGNAYCLIQPGPRGFVDQLWPLDPQTVTPKQQATKRIVYYVRQPSGQSLPYTEEEIFHLRGASDDGVEGKGILRYARDSVGIALATESYAGRLFSQGALQGGTITVPGLLNGEASKRMADSFVTSEKQWHRPKVLEQGATYAESKMTPEDAQMLLSRQFSIDDIARWLGVPPHMIGSLERSTNNNIEQQGQEFVTYSLGPWLSLWEFAINRQLVLNPARFFVEFTRDALVRGDIAARWEAHVNAVNAGIKSVDEVRVVENLNRRGGEADKLRVPQNITGKPVTSRAFLPAAEPDDKAAAIVRESAARVLRKEVLSAQRAAVKFASDLDGWAEWVREFYATHYELVMQTMLVPESVARGYCDLQCSDLLSGLSATEGWTPDFLAGLATRPATASDLLRASMERPVSVSFAEGAIAPVSVAPPTVTVGPGAVTHTHTHTVTPEPVPVVTKIERAVMRSAAGAIIGVVEEQTDSAGGKKTIKRKLTRDAKGRITGVVEDHGE